MMRLFYILLHGCDHKWVGVGNSTWEDEFGSSGPIAYCVCEKCGRPKEFKNAVVAIREARNG